MITKQSFSVFVPPNNLTLAKDLWDTIRLRCPRSGMSLRKSASDYCIQIAGGPSRQETWWAVRRIVSEVEQRHNTGRVVEIMG